MDTEVKTCTMCKKEKIISAFRSRGGSMRHLLKSRCNQCLYGEHKRWVNNNLDRVKEYREKDAWTILKRCSRRGITPEQLIEKYESQEECCAICHTKIEISESAIDHNHDTGEFRGLLCKTCNRALGMFKDSPKVLFSALEYLRDFGFYGEPLVGDLSTIQEQLSAIEYKAAGGGYTK